MLGVEVTHQKFLSQSAIFGIKLHTHSLQSLKEFS